MTSIYLINGAKKFANAHGRLNHTLQNIAADYLTHKGFQVRHCIIDNGYIIENEINNIAKSDIILYQFPAWWMGLPWIVKKYIDDVFTNAHGIFYRNDGRTHLDPSKKYGSGGLLQHKRFMVSMTWNAPYEAFYKKGEFFNGSGIDAILYPFYKIHDFLGMPQHLPSFIATDVMKNINFKAIRSAYIQHLDRYIIKD